MAACQIHSNFRLGWSHSLTSLRRPTWTPQWWKGCTKRCKYKLSMFRLMWGQCVESLCGFWGSPQKIIHSRTMISHYLLFTVQISPLPRERTQVSFLTEIWDFWNFGALWKLSSSPQFKSLPSHAHWIPRLFLQGKSLPLPCLFNLCYKRFPQPCADASPL